LSDLTDLALAVDIGGTKMACSLVRPDGTLLHRDSIPTPPSDVWSSLAALASRVASFAPSGLAGVGIGSPGPLDLATGQVSPVNMVSWRGFPLAARFSSLFPGIPVYLAGDGACAAAGEHWRGAAQKIDDVIVLVVSTGVGGGLIQGGRLFSGRSGNAGHIGHTVVNLDGDPCPCGGRGCVESVASGPRMVAWAASHGWAGSSAVDLAAAARAGDPVALQAFERAGHAVAAGIVSAAAIADLSAAVVGGGVSQAADLLLPPLRRALRSHGVLDFLRDLDVSTAVLGGDAGLVGAAALVFEPSRYPAASFG
jgi:glucokinase